MMKEHFYIRHVDGFLDDNLLGFITKREYAHNYVITYVLGLFVKVSVKLVRLKINRVYEIYKLSGP